MPDAAPIERNRQNRNTLQTSASAIQGRGPRSASAASTAMRSDRIIASSWSWVTTTKVTPVLY